MSTLREQYVIDIESNKTAVILLLKWYEQLMEDLDQDDIYACADRS